MGEKQWKDYLLSSGTPLEYSVLRALADLGIIDPTEYRYERVNEHGVPMEFSIDVWAQEVDTERNLWLEIFIECKYRHDSTRWVFTPVDYSVFEQPSLRDAFITIDELDPTRRFNSAAINRYSQNYPMCGKGVELLKSDANPKSIREAICQLQFGLVDQVVDAIVHQADRLLGTPTPVFLLVPIVVTTAELWRLRSGTTIESIRESSSLEDVAERHDIVLVHDRPNNQLRRHSEHRLDTALKERHKQALERALQSRREGTAAHYVQRFAAAHPSVFVVIHYSRFRAAIERLLSFVKQSSILETRPIKASG